MRFGRRVGFGAPTPQTFLFKLFFAINVWFSSPASVLSLSSVVNPLSFLLIALCSLRRPPRQSWLLRFPPPLSHNPLSMLFSVQFSRSGGTGRRSRLKICRHIVA